MLQKAKQRQPKRSKILSAFVWGLSRPWLHLLLAVTAASFLAGMFSTLSMGLDVLKYGIAAIAAGLPAWTIVKNPVRIHKAIKGLFTCIFVIATMFWAMKGKGKRTNDASSV